MRRHLLRTIGAYVIGGMAAGAVSWWAAYRLFILVFPWHRYGVSL